MSSFLEFCASGLSFGAAYALLALSINIIYASSGVLNFAQGEFMMLGGMLGWWFYSVVELPYVPAVLAAILGVALISLVEYYLVGVPLLRRRAPLISIIIATLGFSIVIRIGTEILLSKVAKPAHAPFGETAIDIAGAAVVPQTFLILGVTTALLCLLWWFYSRTTMGSASRAVAFQPDGAVLSGIAVSKVQAATFFVGGALAGLAGLLAAPLSFASPFVGLDFAVNGFAAAIIGGLGSWPGAVLGGLFVGLARALLAGYVSPDWANMLTFGLILVALYLRPSGFFTERTA